MLREKAIVGFVSVECIHHIVAVSPNPFVGIDRREIPVEQPIVDIARCVEPVPAPPLAEVWRLQQLIDEMLPGIGPRVVEERLHRRWLGRQSDQIEIRSANQRGPIGFRRKRQLPGLEL